MIYMYNIAIYNVLCTIAQFEYWRRNDKNVWNVNYSCSYCAIFSMALLLDDIKLLFTLLTTKPYFDIKGDGTPKLGLRRLPIVFSSAPAIMLSLVIGSTFILVSADIFRHKNTLLAHFLEVFPVTYPQILTIYFTYGIFTYFTFYFSLFKEKCSMEILK